jgi:hypothetical protein
MNVVITYNENDVLSNVNSLLFAMSHYNCLETKMRQLKARQNLHTNVAITYKENDVLSNVNNLLCRNPNLAKCGGEAQHLEKLGDLESSGTPECSELDNKGKNTLHWGVLCDIGKVLKRRYRKCPHIGN